MTRLSVLLMLLSVNGRLSNGKSVIHQPVMSPCYAGGEINLFMPGDLDKCLSDLLDF